MPSNRDGALDGCRHSVVHVPEFSWECLRSTGGLVNGTDLLIVCVFNESLSYWSAVSNGSCSNRKESQPWAGAATAMLFEALLAPRGGQEAWGLLPKVPREAGSEKRVFFLIGWWKSAQGTETKGPNGRRGGSENIWIKGWGKTERQVFAVNCAITLILPSSPQEATKWGRTMGEGQKEIRKSEA